MLGLAFGSSEESRDSVKAEFQSWIIQAQKCIEWQRADIPEDLTAHDSMSSKMTADGGCELNSCARLRMIKLIERFSLRLSWTIIEMVQPLENC
jgi:hypothetical protein